METEGTIRNERAGELEKIRTITRSAFPTHTESRLVDAIWRAHDVVCSLLFEKDDAALGHLMLSKMRVSGDGGEIAAAALGPVSVLPDCQRQGVGSRLVRAAFEHAREKDIAMIFVLGDPGYYSRFGFAPETARPFASPYAGKDFQALVLDDTFRLPKSGEAHYAPAFAIFGG